MDTEAVAREFRDYAYSVSHDLSAPVRAMVEFSKLLTDEHADTLNEEGKEYLSIIIDNGKKLQTMMDGLLAYSRLNAMTRPFTQADCNRIVENCRSVLRDEINATHATFDIGTLPTLHIDADQLPPLFLALIDNALKFQQRNNAPQIKISADKQGNMWQFAVTDNGIGIAPQFHERIFKLFQRLHTDEEYPGVGVGLTLAQKIVNQHGGRIWCESNPGQGTTFMFTLPATVKDAGYEQG